MSEWRSCFSCLGKVCGCRKMSKKNGKVGDINFSVTNDIKVEVTTQGEDHDVNDERCIWRVPVMLQQYIKRCMLRYH